MHPFLLHRKYFSTSHPFASVQRNCAKSHRGTLSRWFLAAVRRWQRKKMIATLEAMDDRTLCDIGLCRSKIQKIVDGVQTKAPSSSDRLPRR